MNRLFEPKTVVLRKINHINNKNRAKILETLHIQDINGVEGNRRQQNQFLLQR